MPSKPRWYILRYIFMYINLPGNNKIASEFEQFIDIIFNH